MTTARRGSDEAGRPLRADARRNRDAILRAAREAFEADGVFTSLDGIALRAGVGNATLYRNFPTRDDLLAGVIETSFAAALAEADELARTLSPRAALAEWLVRVSWQMRIWHDLPTCLAAAHDDATSPLKSANAPLLRRVGDLVDDAKASGDVAGTVTADDVFELILMLSWAIDKFRDDEAAARHRVATAAAGVFT